MKSNQYSVKYNVITATSIKCHFWFQYHINKLSIMTSENHLNNSDKEVDEVDAALSDLEITLEGGKTSAILVGWILSARVCLSWCWSRGFRSSQHPWQGRETVRCWVSSPDSKELSRKCFKSTVCLVLVLPTSHWHRPSDLCALFYTGWGNLISSHGKNHVICISEIK